MPDEPHLRRVVAIVPALNEAHSIAGVVDRTRPYVDDIVVIDDGSTDDTGALAEAAGASVVRHPRRLGVGAAISTGLARGRADGATAVVQVDGDGQHDPSSIPTLLAVLDTGPDVVVGSRFEQGFEMGRVRRVVLDGFAWLISRRLGVPITDPTSGFRAFGPAAIERLGPVFPLKYLSDTVEVLYLAADLDLEVATVPVRMHARAGGKPSAGTWSSIGYALRMMGIVGRHTFGPQRKRS